MTNINVSAAQPVAPTRPPGWLVGLTAALELGCLAMAVAETNLWLHYVIDAGESISLVGLAFVTCAGVYLFTRDQLRVSLPLTLPWLLFPVITQGDQLIDNLSINWMRLVVHVLLAALFGAPVAVIVMAIRSAVAPRQDGRPARTTWFRRLPGIRQIADGRVRQGTAILALLLLGAEVWVAVRFLGVLMVLTLGIMMALVLVYAFAPTSGTGGSRSSTRQRERFALVVLLAGAAASLALFVGFKNRPGAYQGSPAYYMDPTQQESMYNLHRVPVPTTSVVAADATVAREALTRYAHAFERLLAGYYILDRNYNYDFHNRLFLRSTPLLQDYRAVGLTRVREAERLKADADASFQEARAGLDASSPLAALLDDVRGYADFTFRRVPVLERMTADFNRTEAGLQHSTHLFEGEGKVLGEQLAAILDKHRVVLSSAVVEANVGEFVSVSRSVYLTYANRIVGF